MSESAYSPYPVLDTFTRQQVQIRTGIADDVLGFWIKQGLLQPLPAQRRMHRRFSYEQLHIAVLLNGMRSLGANVGTLRKFAEGLQHGLELENAKPIRRHLKWLATKLVEQRHRMSIGEEVRIIDGDRLRPALSESDLLQTWLEDNRREGADESLLAYALSLSAYDGRWLSAALNITDPWHLTSRDEGGSVWVAWIDADGNGRFADAEVAAQWSDKMPNAAFFLAVGRMIRSLWPEHRDRALRLAHAKEHNQQLQFLAELEERDPQQAARIRAQNCIPENWREIYKPTEEVDMDG